MPEQSTRPIVKGVFHDCAHCGRNFRTYARGDRAPSVTCSLACRDAVGRVDRACDQCGTVSPLLPNQTACLPCRKRAAKLREKRRRRDEIPLPPDLEAEEWRPIPNLPMHEVSNMGRVRSHHTKRLLKLWCINTGYSAVVLPRLGGRAHMQTVHRIVATVFIRPPGARECVNHIDGNRQNNVVGNLEWVTYRENNAHARNRARVTSASP